MQANIDQPLYSVPEALALLKIGRTKLYEEIAEGRIKALKSGQRTFIPAQAIKDWIESLPYLPVNKGQRG